MTWDVAEALRRDGSAQPAQRPTGGAAVDIGLGRVIGGSDVRRA